MAYFKDYYDELKYPVGEKGFRHAQIAAIQSVSAHFFSSRQPAIVVMPTGSGKTAVAAALAFVLRAKRVLIITPSRLLREQMAEKFTSLSDLERISALSLLFQARPAVLNQRQRITSAAEWERLRNFDVVVSTVYGISGLSPDTPEIPQDLFDVVIVDEAHHAPAATWARALGQLSHAKQILLTATPFRRDEKEIKGKLVFSYDIRRAYEDKVFGDLTFRPAFPKPGQSIDEAIAFEAEKQFNADRAAGRNHLVMVRVDSVTRGKELVGIYEKTNLKLALVTGSNSLSTVKRVNKNLADGVLDGLICVNMFGEGFDLPRLKIAALHSPHKSLAVTLQFIGRFARTNDPSIGQATFVAYPEDQRQELQALWTSSAIWPDIVHNISATRVEREAKSKEVFETFEMASGQDLRDLPLSSIQPYFHAKIFRCYGSVDLSKVPDSGSDHRTVYSAYSEKHNASVLIRQNINRPKWISDPRVENITFDLDIIHFDKNNKLLFIGSTNKTVSNYRSLVDTFCSDTAAELSAATINRALNDIDGLRIFNLGMRRKQFGGRSESYRTLAGPGADIELSEADGQSYNRGHSFGKGREGLNDVTIGISTSSKIWSNSVKQIPEYVEWCKHLALKLSSGVTIPTGSGLDKLSAGQPIEEFPRKPVYMMFHVRTFANSPLCSLISEDSESDVGSLTDFDFEIVESTADQIHFRLVGKSVNWDGLFSLNSFPLISPFSDSEKSLMIGRGDDAVSISDYLSEFPPRILLENFDYVEGNTVFDGLLGDVELDPSESISIDWDGAFVNIEIEKPIDKEIKAKSIFDWLQDRLLSSECSFVFNDDGSGEVADFVSLEQINGINVVTLYHCKASSKSKPGSRLLDLYDVCGQAIRSAIWVAGDRLADRLDYRQKNTGVVGTLKGTLEQFREVFAPENRIFLEFRLAIVQPGISFAKLDEGPKQLLLSTKKNARSANFREFSIFGSP